MALLYIAVFVVLVIVIAAIMLGAFVDTPQKVTRNKPRNNTRRQDNPPRKRWNGFSDPDDFPTDGCGDNGW